jgi:hypothetical protein
VEIRNLNGINPGTTVLATTTAGPVTNVGTAALYTLTFATPAAVVSGTSYSVVLRTSVGNTVFGVRGSTAGGSSLANGQVFTTTNSGTAWTAVAADLWFTTYVTPLLTYVASGNLFSGVKDANPVVGLVPRWLTLSWTATNPTNTTVQFQAAASNSINGPFNFVGPDGTAATFFTANGASLSQFNGFRYLKYEALLSTTDNIITPTLNDVTVCFDNDTPLISGGATLSRQQAAGTANAQIAIVSDPGQAANTMTVAATPLTGTGVIVNNLSIDVAGNVTADVAASCTATNSTFTITVTNSANATATATLTVNVTPIDTATITPSGPMTFCEGGSVTLTSNSPGGNQWYLNSNPIGGATAQQYIATASGSYTVTANSCTSSASVAATVTVNPIPATSTITPGGPTTFCEGGSVTLTSSSATGNQWYLDSNPIGGATNQGYVATASGNYTNTMTASDCSSEPSSATTVTVNPIPAMPTIAPAGETTLCSGGNVTLTSGNATGNQWYLDGNAVGGATNQQFIATAAGDYTVTVTTSGCTSAVSASTTVTPNIAPTLTYSTPQSIAFNDTLSVAPMSSSSSITGYAVLSVVPALTTAPAVDASGSISITSAQPTGSHTITIRGTDACGETIDASLTLSVTLTTTYSDATGNCGGNTPCYNSIQAAMDAMTGPGTVNVSGGTFNEDLNLSANTTLNINGDTTVNSLTMSGGVLSGGFGFSHTLTLAGGNWINNGGTFNPGTGTVSFAGGGQTIGGTNATTFNNLTLGAGGTTTNGASSGAGQNAGVSGPDSIAPDETVTGVLTLNGDLTVTSPAKLIMSAGASSTGAGDVIGNLERLGFVTGVCASTPCSNTLSAGNPNNQITITGGTAPTSIVVNLTKAAPASYLAAVQRNYIITESGGSDFTATLRLHYLDSELNGNPESYLNLRRFNGSTWPAVLRTAPVDTNENWVESNQVTGFSEWTFASLAPTATNGSISGQILGNDGCPMAGAVVRLNGTQSRTLITDANGNYSFENVETGGFYSLAPSLLNYHFSPEVRSFSQLGNNTSAVFTAIRDAVIAGNAIDTTEYFVRQHYLDFLGREPDESGFNFWSDQISSCGSDGACIERRTINVSAAYFLSIEFQQTGGLVNGLYQASYGRAPSYAEFLPDTNTVARDVVVGRAGWTQTLKNNKRAFIDAWVLRTDFQSVYGGLTNDVYVITLLSHAGPFNGNRDSLVSSLNSGTITRGEVLKQIVENDGFVTAKRNAAFVMMQYFGYLRRDPDESGYAFWLNKLGEFNGDFERAEMVKAFLVSGEYRQRFHL